MATVSIAGLDKADVLSALYNASRPQGMGFLTYDPKPMERNEATRLLEGNQYFDYLNGRVMKVDLSSDMDFSAGLYDRDNGEGAAERAVAALRNTGTADSPEAAAAHHAGLQESAQAAKAAMAVETIVDDGGVRLGLADVKSVLAPRVDAALKNPS